MPHLKPLVDVPSDRMPQVLKDAVHEVRKKKHWSYDRVLRMHPQDLFGAWCDARGGKLRNRWGDWGVIAHLHFEWPHGRGYEVPHEHVVNGVRKHVHWLGWPWLRSNGYSLEELLAMPAKEAFVLVTCSALVGGGSDRPSAELEWDVCTALIEATGWKFVSLDAPVGEVLDAIAQSGFRGTVITKEGA